MTLLELVKQRRNDKREFKKIIEQQLHPNLEIGGIKIAHRHQGQSIIFSAWSGDLPINDEAGFVYDRLFIGCYEGRFYENEIFLKNVNWLIGGD